ncbi:MAG: 30S ribosomal protein S24e [Promethearchaeota archaeon]
MSFKIEILNEEKNPLIDRTELEFKLDHSRASTPNRLEVKEKISAMKNSDRKLTIIKSIKSHFGSSYSIGKVFIYEKAEDLEYYEPFHIKVRNLPKEKRKEIYQLKRKKEPYKHLFSQE